MKKINELVASCDDKVNPKTGKLLHIIFKVATLLLIIVVMPIIVIALGSINLITRNTDGNIIEQAKVSLPVIIGIFIPWIVITIVSSLLWFYFSKWNV